MRSQRFAGSSFIIRLVMLSLLLATVVVSHPSPRLSLTDATPAAGEYVPLQPVRIGDTRSSIGMTTLTAGATHQLTVLGKGGVPSSGVGAVVINVTDASPTAAGSLTVWKAGATRPLDPQLSFAATGEPESNAITVAPGTNGQVSFYNPTGTTEVLVDVQGYYTSASSTTVGGSFFPVNSVRVVDSANGIGTTKTPWTAASTRVLTVTGQGGVPATNVSAVVLNVGINTVSTHTWATIWPDGAPQPDVSNLQGQAGMASVEQVVTKVSSTGKIDLYNRYGSPNYVIDVQGYFTSPTGSSHGSVYVPLDPKRVFKTTAPAVPVTAHYLSAGQHETVQISGSSGIPLTNVNAASLTITAIPHAAGSYGGIYTSSSYWSVIQAHSNGPVSNSVTTMVSSRGTLDLYYRGTGSVDITIDVAGYFQGPTLPTPPQNVTAIGGDGGAAVSWTHPDSDGRSPISSYKVTASPGGASTTVGAEATSAQVAGLANGTAYTFAVVAINGEGGGAAASPAPSTTPVPGGAVSLSSPIFKDGSTIQQVPASSDPTFTWVDPNTTTASYQYQEDADQLASVTSKQLSWYPAPGQHTLKVRVIDGNGNAGAWASTTFTVSQPPAANTPSDPQALVGPDGSLALSAIESTRDASPATTRFFVVDANGQSVGNAPIDVDSESSGERAATGVDTSALTPGAQLTWWAVSCTATGSGQACSGETAHKQIAVPTPPAARQTTRTTIPANALTTREVVETACSTSSCPAPPAGMYTGAYQGATYSALLSADLSTIPQNAIVSKATLHLKGQPGAAGDVGVDQLMVTWDGATATSVIDSNAVGDPVWTGSLTAGTSADIDLTGLVSNWVNGDSPNDGVRLRGTSGAPAFFDGSNTTVSNRPSIDVDYVVPGAPSIVRQLSVTNGDGGARASWLEPTSTGSATDIDHYNVAVTNSGGTTVLTTTTQGLATTLPGLTNGANYTLSVTAVGAAGTSAATTAAVRPATVNNSAEMIADATAFLQARDQLETHAVDTATDAAAGAADSSRFDATLAAQAPTVVALRGMEDQSNSTPDDGTATMPSLINPVVVPNGSGGATVFGDTEVTRSLVDDSDADADVVDDIPTSLTFSVTGTLTAQQASDATQAPDTVVVDDSDGGDFFGDTPTTPILSTASAGIDSNDLRSVTSVTPGMRGTRVFSTSDRKQAVAWALKHLKDRHAYSDNCTYFISQALHLGVKVPYVGAYGNRKSSKVWWTRTTSNYNPYAGGYPPTPETHSSYTYAGSSNFHQYLLRQDITRITSYRDARIGDIIFYEWKYPNGKAGHHTAMVSARAPSSDNPSNFRVVQNTTDYKYRKVFDAIAYMRGRQFTDIKTFVFRINEMQ